MSGSTHVIIQIGRVVGCCSCNFTVRNTRKVELYIQQMNVETQ